jgi:type VI protein secretion system component Hcp
MIVARLTLSDGSKISGSCRIAGYDGKDGWFPASAFNFGFHNPDEKKSGGATGGGGARTGAPAAPSASTSASARTGGSGTQAGGQPEKREFTGMSISKEVDITSCDLMSMAMQERTSKKGAQDKATADIHILSSRQVGDSQHIYASLKIHLAGVVIQQWSINGSGDERPTEELELRYDKAAMLYQWTDGRLIQQFGPRTWDQDKNRPWQEFKGFDAI